MTCASISELPLRPETGTFVSMDSYAGTLDNPVSLHKYLYANANPVMYVDPSGNFSLMETSIAQGIQATISDLMAPGLTMKKVMTWANLVVTTYDIYQQMKLIFAGEANIFGLAVAIGKGMVTQALLNCALTAALGEAAATVLKVVGIANDMQSFVDAVKSGDPEKILIESLRLAVSVYTLKCQCFTEDTLVSTIDGDRPIGELEAGDKVWAYNTETGENEAKAITAVIVTETDVIVHVKTSDGEDIETTMFHPFYVRHSDKESGGSVYDGEWKAASNLLAGDVLQKIDGSTVYVTEVTVEKLPEIINVYNLEIEDLHTYYVADGVLVHNGCNNPYGKKGGPAHQNEINNIEILNEGEVLVYEQRFDTSGGYKNTRYADVSVYDKNNELVRIYQVGKVDSCGMPVKRESLAIEDLMKYVDVPVIFIPYNSNIGTITYMND